MSLTLNITTVLLMLLSGVALSERTKMLVFDSGSATAYRVELGDDIANPCVTSYSISALQGFRDIDWDFVEDRLYILGRDFATIKSVFVNGTDLRNVTVLEQDSYAIAVAPDERKLFASMMRRRNQPAKIVSMDIDGGNMVVHREARLEAPDMAIDYMNKYVYWTEYLCSCLFRMKYDQADAEVEKAYRYIYVKKNPHAMDFENNLIYGDARRGMYKVNVRSSQETLIYRYPSKYSDETVYDPRTDRLFLYNNENSTDVRVLTTDGTLLGTLEGITLTADERKAIRINPQ